MKKKVLSIMLAAAMLAGLTACGSGGSGSSTGSGDSGQTAASSAETAAAQKSEEKEIVLDFPSWQATEPGFQEFWEAAITEFESRHENVTINMYQVPFDNYVDTLTTLFAAGTAPQITHLPSRFFAQFADMGWFEPLNSRLDQTDIISKWTSLQDSLEMDGEYYGVLLLGNGYSMFYNEALLNEAGIEVPTDEASFLAAVEALTTDSNGDGDPDIFGFGTCQVTDTNFYNEASVFVVGMGGRWSDNGDLAPMTSAETVRALEVYQSLFKNNYTPTGLKVEQKRQYFVEGKLAMIFDGPWVGNLIPSASDEIRDSLKVTSIPFENTPGSVSNSLHIPADISEEEKDLVWEFIQMVAEDEFQNLYMKHVGSPSPNSAIISDDILAERPFMGQFVIDANNAKEIIPSGYENVYSEFTQNVIDAVMQMVTDPYAEVAPTLETLSAKIQSDLQ